MDAVNIWKRNQEFLTWDPFWPDIIFWFYYKLLFPIAAQKEAFQHYTLWSDCSDSSLHFPSIPWHISPYWQYDIVRPNTGCLRSELVLWQFAQWATVAVLQCCVGRCGRRGLINQLTPLSTILQQLPATLTSQTTGLELDTQTFCVETSLFLSSKRTRHHSKVDPTKMVNKKWEGEHEL